MLKPIQKGAFRTILLLSVFAVLASAASAQQNIKIMTYNLLNFNDDSQDRASYFQMVIDSIDPDILVVQEVLSQSAMNIFHTQVLNSNYSVGTFINGPDTDNGIFYKSYLFSFVSNNPISTALRDINEFALVNLLYGDTLRIYSVHLKAENGYSDELKRNQEVNQLRAVTNALPEGKLFIVCGDFNIYHSAESAYINLTNDNGVNDGHVIDIFSLPGMWNHQLYAQYHTQSPRVRTFGGGSIGGMDDRFDMILFSQAIADQKRMYYVDGTMWAVGNDGNHYNDSINAPPNTSVSQAMADALHNASDHLPLVARFVFDPAAEVAEMGFVSPFNIFPNPADQTLFFDAPEVDQALIRILDGAGRMLLSFDYFGLQAEIDVSQLQAGVYFLQYTNENYTATKVFMKQ